jgi:hypothetical protein
LGKDNETVINSFADDIVEVLRDRLHRLKSRGSVSRLPIEIICAGLADAVRVFIKQEPHKRSKLVDKRYRLIFAVSLVDSLLERVVYQKRCKFEIESWATCPSKPGMGADDEGLSSLRAQLLDLLGKGCILDTDVSGWDWQLKWWIMYCGLFVDFIVMEVPPNSDYFEIMFNHELCAARPVFSLSDGTLLQLIRALIMLSGRFVTSFRNSKCRVFIAKLAGSHKAMAMGDDCCEGLPVDLVDVVLSRYASFGYEGKIEHRVSTSIEGVVFCSNLFYDRSAEPVNWLRTVFRYLSNPSPTLAHFAQFMFEVRHLRDLTPQQAKVLEDRALRGVEGSS